MLLFAVGCCCNDGNENQPAIKIRKLTPIPVVINGKSCNVMSIGTEYYEYIRYIDCGEGPISGQFINGKFGLK